jgi:predicted HicB family RNase H-like nuclease
MSKKNGSSRNKNYYNGGNCLNYKGYAGSVEFSEADEEFHGKVLGIKSLISFEGESVRAITEDFQEAVDEYIEFCAEKGLEPEKPFRGSFNVRIGSELHRKAALTALAQGVSLNALVEEAIRQSVTSTKKQLLVSEDAAKYEV